jgi:hypothetical protein
MRRLPKQTLSLKDKMKDDFQWGKDIINYLAEFADSQIDRGGQEYTRKLGNYQLYNNLLNQKDFENECNPWGLSVGKLKDDIKPYNKIYNKVQVLLGEELKRKLNFRAIVTNSEGIKSKEVKRTQLLREYVEMMIEKEKEKIMQSYQQKNPPPKQNEESQQNPESQQIMEQYQQKMQDEVNKVMNPKEIDKYMSTEYQEAREILVQKILNFLIKEQDISEKKNDAFKHGLISGEELIWVGVENNMPVVKILNPLNIFYYKSPETKYIQDGEYAGNRVRMTTSDILDKYGQFLTDEEKDRIQADAVGGQGVFGAQSNLIGSSMKTHNVELEDLYTRNANRGEEGSYGYSYQDDWEVTHVEWKSRAKVGFLTYLDEDGEKQVDLVSEYFKIPKESEKKKVTENGITKTVYVLPNEQELTWEWIPEIWEGIRIGYDIFVNIRKKPNQYRSIDNPWKVHLGYHGLVYSNMNAPTVSMVDRAKPFQYLFFVIVHKLKRLIARDKGMAYIFDTSTIDEKLGLEKTIYYLEENDIHFANPLQNAEQPGSAQRGNIISSLSRSNMQHIMSYVSLMQYLDGEIGDAMGVTKQREGQVGSYEAVTNAQQSIVQSSHITEIYFYSHSKLWEKVLSSLVECAQEAWKNSKITKQFVLDDLSRHTLDFTGNEIYNADFGVFVSNSVQDAELITTLKQMALPILQNQGKLTDIVKIYKSLSSSELEREFQAEEKEKEARELQQQEAQQQAQQAAIKAQKESEEAARQHEWNMQTRELENDIIGKEIDVFKFQRDLDMNNDGVPDPLQIERLKNESSFKTEKLKQEDRHHIDKMKLENKKVSATKEKNNQKKKK